MITMLKRLYKEEEGQGMVEYGLIIALIALAVIGGLTAMSGGLTNLFSRITGQLPATGANTSGN